MSDPIKCWRSDHDGDMYEIPFEPPFVDSYVVTTDHVAAIFAGT